MSSRYEWPVEEVAPEDKQARYRKLIAYVMRLGTWLQGPSAQLLPEDEWERLFAEYHERLEELRRLGDELRPLSLRQRRAQARTVLVDEVMELFTS